MDTLIILLVILAIVLVVRGPKTLPQIGAMFGRGVKAAREEADRIRSGDDDEAQPPRG